MSTYPATNMVDMDAVEEAAAAPDRAARILAEALVEIGRIDTADLVDGLAAMPNSAGQLMDALARVAVLAAEAAELRSNLTEMGF